MKKEIALVSLGLLASVSCYASAEQKAEELWDVMNADALYDNMYRMIEIPIVCQTGMSAAEAEEFKKEFMEIADLKLLTKKISQFWIQNYTEEELDQLISFYKTDLGKKSIALMPQYTQFAIQESEKWMQDRKQKFIELGQKTAQRYPKRPNILIESCIRAKTKK